MQKFLRLNFERMFVLYLAKYGVNSLKKHSSADHNINVKRVISCSSNDRLGYEVLTRVSRKGTVSCGRNSLTFLQNISELLVNYTYFNPDNCTLQLETILSFAYSHFHILMKKLQSINHLYCSKSSHLIINLSCYF
jgi:hypothetical protein